MGISLLLKIKYNMFFIPSQYKLASQKRNWSLQTSKKRAVVNELKSAKNN